LRSTTSIFNIVTAKKCFKTLICSLNQAEFTVCSVKMRLEKALLRLMSGLLFPTSGNCEVNGFSSARRQPAFLAEVFLIPEEVWLPDMKIGKYVETHAPFYPKFDHDQFYSWLREFEVPENEKMNNLSFGQKKKLVIAFGLAANTKIVLMDEPTNGLDIPSKAEFRRIVASALDENRTLVISTHQVRDLDSLIDGVIVVEGGEILIDATLDKVSDTLIFSVENTVNESDADLLFAEGGIFGKQTVRENKTGKISRVDLELLFQAAVNNPSRMKAIFK
jgi:ABC-2 type transport system ATP-binding protein